ncbi:MAG TPA: 4'-phosphopantetheinyl transferase superfamily protein [Kofleriaceae bacterium]|jgi:4'-phosphopantetheinyl transferase EntD|nr:4'-phosphopantetheinyl transferase superfamily protein [Kofleriaceae bacterium]
MLRALLPAGVAFAELAIAGVEPPLFADEAAAVARAVAKRRREFAFGRACARAALGAEVAIGVGQGGAPIWPAGVTGSITHTDDYAAAAVVRAGHIGIDVELVARIAEVPGLAERVALPSERGVPVGVVFSAKESVYKCLYPTAERFLEFAEVELAFDRDGFRVLRASGYANASGVIGRFARSADRVATVAWLA